MQSIISADQLLIDSALMEFTKPVQVQGAQPGAVEWGDRVKFQFPPRVVSDSRRAEWNKKETAGQVEPIANYASSGPRTISLQIVYIYDGIWNCKTISEQVRKIRGYFQRAKDLNAQRNLAIRLKLWCIGGPNPMTFRMENCSVRYSETMIFESQQGVTSQPIAKPDNAWPLRTELTCDLATWTQNTSGGEEIQPLTELEPFLVPEWY